MEGTFYYESSPSSMHSVILDEDVAMQFQCQMTTGRFFYGQLNALELIADFIEMIRFQLIIITIDHPGCINKSTIQIILYIRFYS